MTTDPYTFPIDDWMPRFSIKRTRRELTLGSHGPASICYREQLCAWASETYDLGRSVPTDVFVLGWGEPDRRDMTKFGGLPYRPRGMPWPLSQETGKPLTFFCQLRFRESRDLLPPLPGDMLLCFFEDSGVWPFDGFPGPPVFEWYPLGLDDLARPDEVPTPGFDFPVCYGLRHRTRDYVEPHAVYALRSVLPPRLHYMYSDNASLLGLTIWNNIKIGGVPCWANPQEIAQEGVEPGPFLASLAPMSDSLEEWPWVNSRAERWGRGFSWSEEGTAQLFLDNRGRVHPRIQLWGGENVPMTDDPTPPEWRPKRPRDAVDCPECGGTGATLWKRPDREQRAVNCDTCKGWGYVRESEG